jgi:hypothetical protein
MLLVEGNTGDRRPGRLLRVPQIRHVGRRQQAGYATMETGQVGTYPTSEPGAFIGPLLDRNAVRFDIPLLSQRVAVRRTLQRTRYCA